MLAFGKITLAEIQRTDWTEVQLEAKWLVIKRLLWQPSGCRTEKKYEFEKYLGDSFDKSY